MIAGGWSTAAGWGGRFVPGPVTGVGAALVTDDVRLIIGLAVITALTVLLATYLIERERTRRDALPYRAQMELARGYSRALTRTTRTATSRLPSFRSAEGPRGDALSVLSTLKESGIQELTETVHLPERDAGGDRPGAVPDGGAGGGKPAKARKNGKGKGGGNGKARKSGKNGKGGGGAGNGKGRKGGGRRGGQAAVPPRAGIQLVVNGVEQQQEQDGERAQDVPDQGQANTGRDDADASEGGGEHEPHDHTDAPATG
ncbi:MULTISPECIES: hypothetical protein [Actinomadura]|uniref:Uncharacterized protein n=1 Tax=Actinomadura yumaensis TaxID=111807 RepID=A0ABW2CQG4_9ACTN|nr:hypothetical protein [Actinomadura sp. J1-007]MWK40455.1 hypothetical protein [Actinomadura sp. J1-007]